jgi:hypothetical protein
MQLTPKQDELCRQSQWDFSDLRALFINWPQGRVGSSPTRPHRVSPH